MAYSYEVFTTTGSHRVSVENPNMQSLIHLDELIDELAGDAPDRLKQKMLEYRDPEKAPKIPTIEFSVFSYKRHDRYDCKEGKLMYSPAILMDENGYGYAYGENKQESDSTVQNLYRIQLQ